MIQQMTAQTGAQTIVIGAMLFFIGVFAFVAVRVLSKKRGFFAPHAQLPLEEAEPARRAAPRAEEGG